MSIIYREIEAFSIRLDRVLHEKNKVTDVLAKIESLTGIKRLYITLGFFLLIALYLVFGWGAELMCDIIFFTYPSYASVAALESHNKQEITKFMAYWLIYGVYGIIEYFSIFIRFWFSLYWLLKAMFLFWCLVPLNWNGSLLLYHSIIRPAFIRHQESIDSAMCVARHSISQVFNVVPRNTSEDIEPEVSKLDEDVIRRAIATLNDEAILGDQ